MGSIKNILLAVAGFLFIVFVARMTLKLGAKIPVVGGAVEKVEELTLGE